MVPAEVGAYCQQVGGRLNDVLGDSLVGLYLHGSGATGGWLPERSDVDLLAVATRQLTEHEKRKVAAALGELGAPGLGLEFSLVAELSLEPLTTAPAFELHITTGKDAKVVDGAGHSGDADLVMHFAVCRERGVTVFGPPAAEVFPAVPREMLLRAFADEVVWGHQNAPARYAILNACRAWAFAEDGRLPSKIEGGEWAIAKGVEVAVVQAALAAQRGGPEPTDPAAVERLVEAARKALHDAKTPERDP